MPSSCVLLGPQQPLGLCPNNNIFMVIMGLDLWLGLQETQSSWAWVLCSHTADAESKCRTVAVLRQSCHVGIGVSSILRDGWAPLFEWIGCLL